MWDGVRWGGGARLGSLVLCPLEAFSSRKPEAGGSMEGDHLSNNLHPQASPPLVCGYESTSLLHN